LEKHGSRGGTRYDQPALFSEFSEKRQNGLPWIYRNTFKSGTRWTVENDRDAERLTQRVGQAF
jgi:hypothetical protein